MGHYEGHILVPSNMGIRTDGVAKFGSHNHIASSQVLGFNFLMVYRFMGRPTSIFTTSLSLKKDVVNML